MTNRTRIQNAVLLLLAIAAASILNRQGPSELHGFIIIMYILKNVFVYKTVDFGDQTVILHICISGG